MEETGGLRVGKREVLLGKSFDPCEVPLDPDGGVYKDDGYGRKDPLRIHVDLENMSRGNLLKMMR